MTKNEIIEKIVELLKKADKREVSRLYVLILEYLK